MTARKKILIYIPARSGSQRIPNKNARKFLGRPLIAYTIEQAISLRLKGCSTRVIVDTDSSLIANIALRYGAEVPFLRPARLARNNSQIIDSILYTLARLKKGRGYIPDYILLLQTTSPLRETQDIIDCWRLLRASNATTTLTVCPTEPKFYNLDKDNNIILVNGSEEQSSNVQDWKPGYILNGCFVYFVETQALIEEKKVVTKNTKALICPKWRSIDLDNPEDWVLAEIIYKNRARIKNRVRRFS